MTEKDISIFYTKKKKKKKPYKRVILCKEGT